MKEKLKLFVFVAKLSSTYVSMLAKRQFKQIHKIICKILPKYD